MIHTSISESQIKSLDILWMSVIFLKRIDLKGEEKVNVAKQDNEESSLLIILSDNHSYVLFQGLSGFLDY